MTIINGRATPVDGFPGIREVAWQFFTTHYSLLTAPKGLGQAVGLPSEFYKPILLHADINEAGGHEDITGILLVEVPCVPPEEQLVVKKNLGILMESMVLRTHEILDYYGNPHNTIPRYFA